MDRAAIGVRIVAIYQIGAIPEVNLFAVCSKHRGSILADCLTPDNGILRVVETIGHLAAGELVLSHRLTLAATTTGVQIVAVGHGTKTGAQISNHAANRGAAANSAGIVTVGHCAAITHHAADIICATDRASIVTVGQGAVIAHHAADIRFANDGASVSVVAVGQGDTVCISRHAADIIASAADGAGVITIGYGGIRCLSHHTADFGTAADGTGIVAVGHFARTAAMISHHAADTLTGAADSAADGVIAVGHASAIARHAADIRATNDGTGVVAVGHAGRIGITASRHAADIRATNDSAGIVTIGHVVAIAHHAADIILAVKVGILNTYLVHLAFIVSIAKEANIADGVIIEIKTADSVAVALKGSGEAIIITANGRPCTDSFPIVDGGSASLCDGNLTHQVLIDDDVGCQLTIDAGSAGIHIRRKGVKFIGRANFVEAVTVGVHQRNHFVGVNLNHRQRCCCAGVDCCHACYGKDQRQGQQENAHFGCLHSFAPSFFQSTHKNCWIYPVKACAQIFSCNILPKNTNLSMLAP